MDNSFEIFGNLGISQMNDYFHVSTVALSSAQWKY